MIVRSIIRYVETSGVRFSNVVYNLGCKQSLGATRSMKVSSRIVLRLVDIGIAKKTSVRNALGVTKLFDPK